MGGRFHQASVVGYRRTSRFVVDACWRAAMTTSPWWTSHVALRITQDRLGGGRSGGVLRVNADIRTWSPGQVSTRGMTARSHFSMSRPIRTPTERAQRSQPAGQRRGVRLRPTDRRAPLWTSGRAARRRDLVEFLGTVGRWSRGTGRCTRRRRCHPAVHVGGV